MARYRKSGLNPRTKIRLYIVLILLVAVLAGFLDYPKIWNNSADFVSSKIPITIPHYANLPFHLGLDLQGGTHLVYSANVSDVPSGEQGDAVEGVRDVIERRVNSFGVAEPLIQTNKVGGQYRVIVELAGIKDVNDAIKMIGETPLLEFKEQPTTAPELTEEQRIAMDEYNADARDRASEIKNQLIDNPDDFTDIAKDKSEDAISKENGGEIGFIKASGPQSDFYDELEQMSEGAVYSMVIENTEGYNILKKGESNSDEKEVQANHLLICYEGAERCESNISKDDARTKIEGLKSEANADNFIELAKANSTEPGADTGGGDLGWFGKGMMVPEFEGPAFSMAVGDISDIVETQFGFHLIFKTDERQTTSIQAFRILIKKQKESDIVPQEEFVYTGLSGKHLERSTVTFNPNTNEAEVSIEFNDEGKDLFAEITGRNVGKPVGIFLDGEAISLPTVNSKITEGNAVITGKFSLEESKTLVRRLNAGALPVPIELISQQTVGASLGQESLDISLSAALLGLILVGLFMIIYYRLPGLTAVLSLLVYGIIILAIFKIIPVTLTLAGIAGFILSLGMAVDANVLIFERMKEELKLGKPLGTSIEEGFKRAWPSIRDGNASTLITCVILYWFGTSIIQGFALTLFIGILISMISALYITKNILQLFSGWKWLNKINWLFLYKETKQNDES